MPNTSAHAVHHEGAVAKDNAHQHNGAYYSGAAFHGGTHIHYHSPGQDAATQNDQILTQKGLHGRPFYVLQVAIDVARYLQCAENAVQTLSDINKGGAWSAEELDDVLTVVARNQLSVEALVTELNVTRDTRDVAKAGTTGVKIADGIVAAFRDVAKRTAKTSRHNLFAKSKHIPGVDKYSKQILSAQKELLTQVYEIVRQVNPLDDRRYDLAAVLKSVEQSITEGALLVPFHRCLTQLKEACASPACCNAVEILETFQHDGERLLHRTAFLTRLRFEGMQYRRAKVEDAHPRTYNWMFPRDPSEDKDDPPHEPEVDFAKWLRSSDSSIYWITGKAGSGKSTLMKYISTDARSGTILNGWTRPNGKLCTSSHYFWYQGNLLQKSYEGLLRAILYDICQQHPDIIEQVCDSPSAFFSWPPAQPQPGWELDKLQQCVLALSRCVDRETGHDMRFCLFIDGLDEYDGDHDEVLGFLQKLACAGNVKLCVSSRPWEVFQQAFAASADRGYGLILHQHTKADIALVVASTLDSQPTHALRGSLEAIKLVDEIVKKAEGVFLWVRLVLLREVIPGLRYADSIGKLRQRISKLPPGLFEYFQHIFDRINTDYREETARLFLACQKAFKPLPLPAFGVIINDDPVDVSLSAPIDDGYNWSGPALVKTIRAQVNGRCQDLLAVEPSKGFPPHHIEFLHRSVKEFLEEPDIHAELVSRAGRNFEADTALFATYVLLVKMANTADLGPWDTEGEWSELALVHAACMATPASFELLDHLDRAMSKPANTAARHWTKSMYADDDRDFLRHAISFGIVSAVRTSILRDPQLLSRPGKRPHLDYALRYNGPQPPPWPMAVSVDDPILLERRVAMVEFLMSSGASLTHRIYQYDNRTVWDLYLVHLYHRKVPKEEGRRIVWACIAAGVRDLGKCEISGSTEYSMSEILWSVFGASEAQNMCEAIQKNEPTGAIHAAWAWLKRGPLRDIG